MLKVALPLLALLSLITLSSVAQAADVYPTSSSVILPTSNASVSPTSDPGLINALSSVGGTAATITQTVDGSRGHAKIRVNFSTPENVTGGSAYFKVNIGTVSFSSSIAQYAMGVARVHYSDGTTDGIYSVTYNGSSINSFNQNVNEIQVRISGLTTGKAIDSIDLNFNLSSKTPTTGDYLTLDAVHYPEPASIALFGLGLLGFGGYVVRKRHRHRKV